MCSYLTNKFPVESWKVFAFPLNQVGQENTFVLKPSRNFPPTEDLPLFEV